jgi:rhodanese-related sulfurtransferase
MIEQLTPERARELIEAGEVELIDVREQHEWSAGHIPQARHVPLSRLRTSPKAHLQRDKLLFVCAAGARSNMAAQLAVAIGHSQVYNLAGGTQAWKKTGLPFVLPQQQVAG